MYLLERGSVFTKDESQIFKDKISVMITRKLILKDVSWKGWKACSLHFYFWKLLLILVSSIKGLL